ncbi:MAG TPA: hypothetical protein VG326_04270 [Tepidisphaeraceae bacterium]|nr:hypothetical protein [Tepidisphaeraceae bacterium]
MKEKDPKDPFRLDDELDAMLEGLDAEIDAAIQSPGKSGRPAPDQPRDSFAPSRPLPGMSEPRENRTPAAGRGLADRSQTPFTRPQEIADPAGLTVICVDTINALLDHVHLPTVPKLSFRNRSARAYTNLRVRIGGGRSQYIGEWAESVGRLPPGDVWTRTDIRLPLFNMALRGVIEQTNDAITVEVIDGATTIAVRTIDVKIQPYAHWPMIWGAYWTLAAFVWPNQSAVQDLIKRAAALQQKKFGTTAFEGYQGMRSRPERVRQQVASLHDALGPDGIGLNYINPPASFLAADGSFGQKIRFPNNVVTDGRGTCLDLTVLLASMLEQINVDPLLVLIYGHAFVGYMTEEGPGLGAMSTNLLEDKSAQSLYAGRKIEFLNSVNMTFGEGFESACKTGRAYVEQRLDALRQGRTTDRDFVVLIDIKACRREGIVPLPPL